LFKVHAAPDRTGELGALRWMDLMIVLRGGKVEIPYRPLIVPRFVLAAK
jgi:hypothetical protein